MSAAIKRLSTIIRPSNSSSPPSPPKESGKNSIDAPAAPALVDAAATAETSPKAEETPSATTPDGVKDAVDSAPPEKDAAAAPVSTNGAKDEPSTPDAPKDKDATAPATAETKTEKEATKPTHRRDPRDIGRSTIRRFSTILRSQAKDAHKDKEPTPPLPSQEGAAKVKDGETKASEEQAPAAEEAPKEDAAKENGTADSVPVEKNAKAAKPAPSTKDKTDTGKVTKRRSSSFFTAAREGLQRTAKDVQTRARRQPGAAKVKGLGVGATSKAEAVPKIVKKGAAKGKRVVVITGASQGVGLEFVKQFADQPNMFVIALSRTADKSTALKPIVSASAKEGHNVRAIKLDVSSSRSIHNVVKDIVELTDGRIDLIINAAGSRGDPGLKVWDLKGSELEEELRTNLVGPIAFTNALIPYLKVMPPKEEKKGPEKDEKTDTKEEKTEAKESEKEKTEEKKEEKAEEKKAETVEKPQTTEVNSDAQEPVAATTEPSVETPAATADKQEATTAEAPIEKPTEAAPAEGETTGPSPAEVPSVLPAQPFVVFLAPSDPIQNVDGAVPAGNTFVPSPRTLFSLSRAALQVAIAKYAVGLAGRNIGIVGLERYGLHDPHSGVTDGQSVAGVIKFLPELSIRDNGKLLKTSA